MEPSDKHAVSTLNGIINVDTYLIDLCFENGYKIANLRVFGDENDVMNRSILDVEGEALVVSQFTLYASYKKGNRPSWFRAGSHEHSIPLYEAFCKDLSEAIGKPVGTGEFGADMKVELLNDGPVTICMDTKNKE